VVNVKNDKVVELFEKCYTQARSQWSNIHRDFKNDKKFIQLGEQLTQEEKTKLKGRPMFVINKLMQYVKKVTNEMRQTAISCKVRPVDNGADIEKAKVRQGVIRAIERQCNANYAYQYAGEEAVTGGIGAFRINTDYISDKSFDQTIKVQRILDASTVFYGPAKEPDFSDAEWCIIQESGEGFSKTSSDYERMASPETNEGIWGSGEVPYEYEFWYCHKTKDTLYRLKAGRSVFKSQLSPDASDDIFVMRDGKRLERETYKKHWMCYKLKANQVKDSKEWMGKFCPIVITIGREVWVEGKRTYLSLCRYSKDSQKLYNYARQEMARRIGLAPKATWLVPIESIPSKFMNLWQTAHEKTVGMLPWTSQGKDGQQLPSPSIPQVQNVDPALVNEVQFSDGELKDTTGIHEASLGTGGDSQSGIALRQKQREGDVSTYDFQDNLAISVRHGCRIINDLIPKIIDTPRQVRMVGEDEEESVITVNQENTDPKTGKSKRDYYFSEEEEYDIMADVGPSYATKRLENSDALLELMRISPAAAQGLPHLYVKQLDFNYADEASKILKNLLPPGVVENDEEEGQQMPPEAIQAIEQAKMMQEQLQQVMQEMEQLKQDKEIEYEKLELSRQESVAKALQENEKIQIDKYDSETRRMQVEKQAEDDLNQSKEDVDNKYQEDIKQIIEQFNQKIEESKPKEEPKQQLPDIHVNVSVPKGGAKTITAPGGQVYEVKEGE
jgi:hypothetical protein